MPSDLLSDMLDLQHVRSGLSGRLVASGTWTNPTESTDTISFCAATKGSCWYFVEGMAAPAPFRAGDVLVVNFREILHLGSDPALIPTAVANYPTPDPDRNYRYGEGEDFCMLSGSVAIGSERQTLLQRGLPPHIHIDGSAPEAAPLAWLIDQLLRESGPDAQPGTTTIIAALAQLLFAHALRAYLVSAPSTDAGWLKVFADTQLTSALEAIHADPARPWTVAEMAARVGMSRTTFSERFRRAMGMPPLAYVTSWRMRLAGRALHAGLSVAEAAERVGYTSESAFSAAFKRAIGIAPGAYRRNSREERQRAGP